MPDEPTPEISHGDASVPRWQELYRVAAVASPIFAGAIVFAIVAYFLWPYSPGVTDIEVILTVLHENRLAGLMSLDLVMVLIVPIAVLPMLALYAALKEVSESYALIALALGLMGNTLILTARPVAEMAYLSDQFATATSPAAQAHYLASAEALHTHFDGTTWMWWTVLTNLSSVLFCTLMLRSRTFGLGVAYLGMAIALIGLGVFIPGVGSILSLAATLGSVAWFILLARAFARLGWTQAVPRQALNDT